MFHVAIKERTFREGGREWSFRKKIILLLMKSSGHGSDNFKVAGIDYSINKNYSGFHLQIVAKLLNG